jgi:amino acid efflux transporter
VVTAGQRGDSPQFAAVLGRIRVPRAGSGHPRTRPDQVLADKAYGSRANRAYLRRRKIASATILVLGAAGGRSVAPVADLLVRGAGGPAHVIAAVMAVLLTLGVMNAYLAGAAKLGAALARDGAMPGWLADGSRAGQVPRRSLLFIAALSGAALFAVAVSGASTHPLVLLVNGALVVVYALGTAAAIRLLPRRSVARRAAVTAFVASLALAVSIGWYLAWAAALAGGALLYLRHRERLPTQARSRDHERRTAL